MQNFDYDLKSIQEARDLARMGHKATEEIANYSDEQIDKIIQNMVKVAKQHAVELAKIAVEETGFGNVPDKTYKIHLASQLLYDSIKNMKTAGIINEDKQTGVITVAEPVGLLFGIVPSTNPPSTTIYKSIVAIKARNAIVFSPHPSAAKSTIKAAQLMCEAAVAAGAPKNIVTCVTLPSLCSTNELMKCDEVKMIIATGGPGMVKAAYSSGKPALGVGAGNSPAYIERTADVQKAVRNIIASKTFDYGTICASEQSIVCEQCNKQAVITEFEKQGGYFMNEAETNAVTKLIFKADGHTMNADFVGRNALYIAKCAGITVPEGTKVLIGEQGGVGKGYPLSFEKLTTVLGFYVVNNWQEACDLSIELLQNGIGHTMSLHTEDRNIVLEFIRKPASRILINTGSAQGGTGASTGLMPSFTLGCGTKGGSSVSENVTPLHLINTKCVAYGIVDVDDLVAKDPTFNYPELRNYTNQTAGNASSGSGVKYSSPVSIPSAVRAVIPSGSASNTSSYSTGAAQGQYLSPSQYANAQSSNTVNINKETVHSTNLSGVSSNDIPLDMNQLRNLLKELANTEKG